MIVYLNMELPFSGFFETIGRFFSTDTFNGESNVFSNFAQILREVRTTAFNFTIEAGKQLFEVGSEAIKSARDSFASAIGIDPSKFDAGNAASKMGSQSGAAQSAMGMPSMGDFGGNSGSISLPGKNSSVPTNSKLKQKLEQQRLLKQMNEQRQAVSG
jgi:hypothetical protein